MNMWDAIDREGQQKLRNHEAFASATEFTKCHSCYKIFADKDERVARGEPCPMCATPSAGAIMWPNVESIECIRIALEQDWQDERERMIGKVFLAVGAEAVFSECLFEVVSIKTGDRFLGRRLVEQCDGKKDLVELFKVFTGQGLCEFWGQLKLRDAYDDWDALTCERNKIVHGKLWPVPSKERKEFKRDPKEFVHRLLEAMAQVHNTFAVGGAGTSATGLSGDGTSAPSPPPAVPQENQDDAAQGSG